MNKLGKRITIKLLISMLGGGAIAIILLMQRDSSSSILIDKVEDILNNHTLFVYLFTFIVLILPALGLQIIGRKAYLKMVNTNEGKLKDQYKKKSAALDISLTLVHVFLACNFLQYGALYHSTTENTSTLLVFFFIGIMIVAALEVSTVKYVQKYDRNLKGDPTKTNFNNEFINSLDKKQQNRVYKAGYNTLQLMRSMTQILIITSIFMNIIFNTGGFAILISCLFMIMQTVIFSIQEQITQS